MSSLNEYLAKHYGSSSNSDKKRKSKKTQHPASSAGLNVIIADDDDDRVYSASKPVKEKTSKPKQPVFRSTQQSWRTIREPNADETPKASSAKYGLLTSDMIKDETDRVRKEQAVRRQKLLESQKGKPKEETIYRDPQTGKRIDIEQAQREEHQRQADQQRQQQQQVEWNKGLAQQRAELGDRRLEEEMRNTSANELEQRYARERDQELKDRQHWNDPALNYLQKKKKRRKADEVYLTYQGYVPPNRFDIRPGYRWDGVDRSNGFEKQHFRRQANATNKKADDYSASVADW